MAISKINEKVFKAFERLEELSEYDLGKDFDTREGMICANIKVYEWLDEDDVVKLITKNGWHQYVEQISEEFDEERLNSIYNHVCEWEVSYLKDVYEDNVDLANFDFIFRVWNQSHNEYGRTKEFYIESQPKSKFYTERYWNQSLEFDTFDSWRKFIINESPDCYNRFVMRSKVGDISCWQYGRSGGWLSLCSEGELNFEDVIYDNFGYRLVDDLRAAYNKDNNREFNEALANLDYGAKDKVALIKQINSIIKEANEKIEATKFIIAEIEDGTKYFKETLLSRLEDEMHEFVGNECVTTLVPNTTITLTDNKVETSLGVSVDLKEFKENLVSLLPAFMLLDENNNTLKIDRRVGNYFVERASKVGDDVLIKAGCHRFSLNNLLTTFNLSL